MMKCYLINLDCDTERLAHMQAGFARLPLPFERFEAVDVRQFSDEEFKAYCKIYTGLRWYRGKMGCFLSHHTLWQKIAQGPDNYAVIMEDDLHFADDLPKILENEAWIPADADIIRLEVSTNRLQLDKKEACSVSGRKLQRLRSTSYCAGAYIIKKETAQHLVNLPNGVFLNPDSFLFSWERSSTASNLVVYQFNPALIIQDKFAFGNRGTSAAFKSHLEIAPPEPSFMSRLLGFCKKLNLSSLRKLHQGYVRVPFAARGTVS